MNSCRTKYVIQQLLRSTFKIIIENQEKKLPQRLKHFLHSTKLTNKQKIPFCLICRCMFPQSGFFCCLFFSVCVLNICAQQESREINLRQQMNPLCMFLFWSHLITHQASCNQDDPSICISRLCIYFGRFVYQSAEMQCFVAASICSFEMVVYVYILVFVITR